MCGIGFLAAELWLELHTLEVSDVPRFLNRQWLVFTRQDVLKNYRPTHGIDADVLEEKQRVGALMAGEMGQFAVALRDLWLAYPPVTGNLPLVAVRELTLGLQFGETFGLLGPNGAGKSTTISTLAGMLRDWGGSVFLGGQSIRESTIAIHTLAGFCEQHDVVWDDLTTEETLNFVARIRGFRGGLVFAEVQRVASAVGLDADANDTKASELSGGMRRRLSIGMSISGDPCILIFDEPTTGLDTGTRQSVWRIIEGLKHPNRLIMITTHAMEKADALGTRIGIMCRGTLQAVSTSVHLKTRFGHGNGLVVNTLTPQQLPAVDNYVRETVCNGKHGPDITVNSVNRTHRYVIPREAATVSSICAKMEAGKRVRSIREWGLRMTSLEDVFLSMAQRAEDGFIPEPGDEQSGGSRDCERKGSSADDDGSGGGSSSNTGSLATQWSVPRSWRWRRLGPWLPQRRPRAKLTGTKAMGQGRVR